MKSLKELLLLSLGSLGSTCWPEAEAKKITYSVVGGYFLQDAPETQASNFDYAQWNLGLINRTYSTDETFDPAQRKPQWERFSHWLEHVASTDGEGGRLRYKLLVMARHGQGWHNAAESFYGTPAWNCYWSVLDGNGTAVWADAQLTQAGVDEALKANAFFKSHFAHEGLPFFQSYYSSPLTRCITTANLTFGNISVPESRPFAPVIKDYLRERISIHTCDRRSNKTYIGSLASQIRFEEGFTEFDELWDSHKGETAEHQRARSKLLLDDIFVSDESLWISLSAHSGEIRRLLEVLGHREFSLNTGQIIPVLVKAEVAEADMPTTITGPAFTSEATCTEPPVTSISGEGCVCSDSLQALEATAELEM